MVEVWRYFEDLDEIIYVVDTDDHSIVYMNRYAMKTFKIKSEEEYKGKKCYELLQGFRHQCPFCNTEELKEKKFTEWVYKNPVLQELFLLKDTLIAIDGKKYRMELAIGMSKTEIKESSRTMHYESLINDCLIEQNAITDSEQGINVLLSSMGNKMKCNRLAVYEQDDDDEFVQSYIWPERYADKKKKIDKGASELLLDWDEKFKTNKPIIIGRKNNIILIPFRYRKERRGVFVIVNPMLGKLEDMAEIGRVMSNFIVTLLERKELINHLVYLSYHDNLTGALNRNAIKERMQTIDPDQPIGLVFCDINGLKKINDMKGHQSGDEMIIKVYETLNSVFSENSIYRMGGDEFLVLLDYREEDKFTLQVQMFRRMVMENNCQVSVGVLWKKQAGNDFNRLLKEADERMYEEKKQFYAEAHLEKRGRKPEGDRIRQESVHPFIKFTQNYYFDADVFFKSISSRSFTNYVYCGDMRKNIYYISDSIKDDFKFMDNLVYDFISLLEQRIIKADRQFHIDDRKEMIEKKKTWHSIYYRIYNKDGIPVNIHCQGIMKWNEDKSEPLFYSGCMEILDNEPNNDNLPVSQYFSQVMEEFRAKEDSEDILLICVVLNNFSAINQLMGNRKGDNIIWEIMRNIRLELNERIKLVWVTGIRFIMIARDTSNIDNIIKIIRKAVRQIYIDNQISIIYPCSVGILRSPRDGADSETLLENAEIVMNAAKNTLDAPYVEFSRDMMRQYKGEKELYMELNRCIRNLFENFRIVIQPQVLEDTGKIYGGEVLLRWKYKGEDVPPSKFIPILEKNGLIMPVGKWIITQAAETLQQILAIMPDFKMSINISYYQINDNTFFPFIKNTLETHKIPGENITLELTETHFNEIPEALDIFIRQCQKEGISFALDDFGSAYSSLQLLLEYPAEVVKLDRDMTKNITSSAKKLNFIISIIYACHKFGKKVCVEGVENENELNIVRKTGCDFIQGFYFYRPLEKDRLPEVLRENRKKD